MYLIFHLKKANEILQISYFQSPFWKNQLDLSRLLFDFKISNDLKQILFVTLFKYSFIWSSLFSEIVSFQSFSRRYENKFKTLKSPVSVGKVPLAWNLNLELTLVLSFLAPPLYNFILIYINMVPFFLKLNSSSLFTSQKKLPISHKKMDKCHHQRIFLTFSNRFF